MKFLNSTACLIALAGLSLSLSGCIKKEKVEKAVEDAVGATAIRQGEAMKEALREADSLRKARVDEIDKIK
jgi:hypothetical protein